jgi:5-methylcytosine-specific restriction endonuclease McrA
VPRPPSSTKVCQKCKVRKLRAEFLVAADDTEDPEVSLFCETCRTTFQTCLMCGIAKPVCEFNHQSNRHGHCKACRRNPLALMAALERVQRSGLPDEARHRVSQALRMAYARDPDEGSKRTKRRRAKRLRAAPRERIDREMIFERDEWVCGICGERVAPEDATLDHIVPVALGGAHTAANLRLAHAICNSRRQANTPS